MHPRRRRRGREKTRTPTSRSPWKRSRLRSERTSDDPLPRRTSSTEPLRTQSGRSSRRALEKLCLTWKGQQKQLATPRTCSCRGCGTQEGSLLALELGELGLPIHGDHQRHSQNEQGCSSDPSSFSCTPSNPLANVPDVRDGSLGLVVDRSYGAGEARPDGRRLRRRRHGRTRILGLR